MGRDNSNINSLAIFRPGSKNRINAQAYMKVMRLAVVTECALQNNISEYMLELLGPLIARK